jgi:PKD repeat protein
MVLAWAAAALAHAPHTSSSPTTRTRTTHVPAATRTATRLRTATRTASAAPTRTPSAFVTATPIPSTPTLTPLPVASTEPSAGPTSTPIILGGGPRASFALDAAAGPAPHVVQFTDTSGGTIATWAWDFGDGGTSSRQHAIHSYVQTGMYTVRLTVSGPAGSSTVVRMALIAVSPTSAPTSAGFAEFVAFCPFSHQLADDPIVFPGQPGQAHIHSFFGSTVTDAHSSVEVLLAGGTTCDPPVDRSAYWVPTLFENGIPIYPEQATFYYFVGNDARTQIRPYPVGLRIIAGSGSRTGPADGPSHYKWSCRGASDSSTGDFVICPAGHELEMLLNFPDCWNGSDLDRSDHQSHMAYSAGGQCPVTHPVPVPQLQFKLRYPTSGGTGLTLAVGGGEHAHTDGRGWTAHGDFFNAWESDALRFRIENCLLRGVKCGADGMP